MKFECDTHTGIANAFIEHHFHDCIYTLQDLVGFCLGMVAILMWLVAQIPQFISNFRNQSSEALSVWFLTQWFLGDTLNLLGCLISGQQLPTTTYLAMYFVVADVFMLTQYIYYGALKSRKEKILQRSLTRPPRRHHHHHHRNHRTKGGETQQQHASDLLRGASQSHLVTASEPLLAPASVQDLLLKQKAQGSTCDPSGQAAAAGGRGSTMKSVGTGVVVSFALLACVGLQQQRQWQSPHEDGSSGTPLPGAYSLSDAVGLGRQSIKRPLAFAHASGGSTGSSHHTEPGGAASLLHSLTHLWGLGRHESADWIITAGIAIGYCSSVLYIVSRLSQIHKTHMRQTAEGLSLAMFVLAFSGNLCTGTSILLRAGNWANLKDQLPWVCGTFGTTLLDAYIFRQALHYGTGPRKAPLAGHAAYDRWLSCGDLERPLVPPAAVRLEH